MYKDLWINTYQSIGLIQHFKGEERVASGSGFIINGYLVTNHHVYLVPPSDRIIIEFSGEETVRIELSKAEFNQAFKEGSSENNWDYAIFDLPQLKKIPSLKFCDPDREISIGMQVALLGYAFGSCNLSIHPGVVSSRFKKNEVEYIQVDASINRGNSGGPLLDPETGDVVGIVTRSATGLTEMFDDVIKSFDGNIDALEAVGKSGTSITFGNVNPLEALSMSQKQMKEISMAIKRSANVGFGFAFTLDEVRKSIGS